MDERELTPQIDKPRKLPALFNCKADIRNAQTPQLEHSASCEKIN